MSANDAEAFDGNVFAQLGNEHQALLDSIDSLRALNIQLDELPQIVVVGDKSSGKSSVLEAISRIPFPVDSGLCTRCPTELVMRKSPKHEVSVQVIEKGGKAKATFAKDRFLKCDLPGIIAEARNELGILKGNQDFSTNTLRIQVSDPKLKDLTLIDLPGIYHAETGEENRPGKAIVRGLANYFMAQPNTIILAVVCGSSQLGGQEILEMAMKHDPKWERTIGVITKPDVIEETSSTLSTYVRLARNEEAPYIMKLGWHVLRNRNSKDNDELNAGAAKTSDKERDEGETEFLNTAPWTSVAAEDKGVDALRVKLSGILAQHVQARLPSLISDMQQRLKAHQEERLKLGEERDSESKRRNFLLSIAGSYRELARSATNGSYEGSFFTTANQNKRLALTDSSDVRKLRAVIRNLNCAFTSVMAEKGAKRHIVWDAFQNASGDDRVSHGGCFFKWGDSNDEFQTLKKYNETWVSLFDAKIPDIVSWPTLRSELEVKAANSRGTQFPGSPNHQLALDLFRDQIKNWPKIALQYIKLVLHSSRAFVQEALGHILGSNKTTQDALYHEYISKFFISREKDLVKKLEELVCHYRDGNALCLEAEFERRMQERNALHTALRVKSLLRSTQDASGSNLSVNDVFARIKDAPAVEGDSFGSETVVEMMAAYYDMSMRTFTENVIILAAENQLVRKIPKLLEDITDHSISAEAVKKLTAESQAITQRRHKLDSEIDALEQGLQICERYHAWDAVGLRTASMSAESTKLRAPMDHFLKSEATTASSNAKSQPSIDFTTTNSSEQPVASRLGQQDTSGPPKFGDSGKFPFSGLSASANPNLKFSSIFGSSNESRPLTPEKNHKVSNPAANSDPQQQQSQQTPSRTANAAK